MGWAWRGAAWASGVVSAMSNWPRCLQASGQSEHSVSVAFWAIWRAAGRRTLLAAPGGYAFITPKVPPWPEQALHQLDTGVRDQPQHLGGFGAHVLGPGVAGVVQGDPALDRRQTLRQAKGLLQLDDVLADVPGRRRERHDSRVLRLHQGPFELHHQAAREAVSATTS